MSDAYYSIIRCLIVWLFDCVIGAGRLRDWEVWEADEQTSTTSGRLTKTQNPIIKNLYMSLPNPAANAQSAFCGKISHNSATFHSTHSPTSHPIALYTFHSTLHPIPNRRAITANSAQNRFVQLWHNTPLESKSFYRSSLDFRRFNSD